MIITGVQFDIVWEDPQANFKKVREILAKNPPAPGGLIVLPEMFATGFSFVTHVTLSAGRPSEDFLKEIAKKYSCYVIGGLIDRAANGHPYNYASLVTPTGERILRYKKIHPFDGERYAYQAGNRICTTQVSEFKICPQICYDLRFPETFRQAALGRTELFVVIANWPSVRDHHWKTLLQARAIENQAYVVGVNRTGQDLSLEYSGYSMIIDYSGNILAQATDAECVISAGISQEKILEFRKNFPFLDDMNPNLASCDFSQSKNRLRTLH